VVPVILITMKKKRERQESIENKKEDKMEARI
jgi:hypothetical protein